jgi:acetoin:2,6-dichlorophenolindophenol oxidoreductase subunit beta
MARRLTFGAAVREGLIIAFETDPNVILIGEDVVGGGGRDCDLEKMGSVLGYSIGLAAKFGRERVRDTPISESGLLACAVGAAATGMRPLADLMFIDFLGYGLDPLLNQAAKLRYMFGGKVSVPLTVLTISGAGMRAAAQHSQSLYWITTGIPGLKTVIPSNAADAKGLVLSAIRDDDPVVFCQPKAVLFSKCEVPEGEYTIPLGKARVAREGSDVTLIAFGATVPTALKAAEQLASEGTSAEVIDLRTLQPLDEDAILASLEKTGRLVVVDESTPRCGIASDIAALCVDRGFDFLNAPVKRVTAPHTPVPFAERLEDAFVPSAEKVVAAVREMS